jgi:sodium transport system permease protein
VTLPGVRPIDWGAVWVLWRRETRSALRDRTIVVNGILVPLVLYPVLLWLLLTGLTFARGQTAGRPSRVAVFGAEGSGALRAELALDRRIEVVPSGTPAEAAQKVRSGELEAAVEVLPGAAGGTDLRLGFSSSKERSAAARERLGEVAARARDRELRGEALARGLGGASWQLFTIEERDVATGREMGRRVLGLLFPLLFVAMVSIGCFTTAVDTTAGERERSTWETLMTVSAPRASIVAAKVLHVAAFGVLSGVLNLAAMALTLRPVLAPLLSRSGRPLDFGVPAAAIPVVLLCVLSLSAVLAASMTLVAVFAKTFKEGQAMLTPYVFLATLPVGLLALPGVSLTAPLALVPVANVALVVREALTGAFPWPSILLAFGANAAAVAACLCAASWVLRVEAVVTGSGGGGLFAFVRGRARRPARLDGRAS